MRARILNSHFQILHSIALVAAITTAACRAAVPASARAQADSTQSTPKNEHMAALRPLKLTPSKTAKPVVGTEIDASAEGLPPSRMVDLIWETVAGGWVVEDGYRFRGKRFTDSTKVLGRARVASDGRLQTHFTIPADFGGVHSVTVADAGRPLAHGGIEVTQTFEMHPSEGPVGTLIELRVTGFGWRTMESTWVVNWDNHDVGYVSATDTRGTASARFRATGPGGAHEIKVYTGYMGQSYLNHEQAPNAYLPRPRFVFRVTPGSVAAGGGIETYPAQKIPAAEISLAGADVRMTPGRGALRTRAGVRGGGSPPN